MRQVMALIVLALLAALASWADRAAAQVVTGSLSVTANVTCKGSGTQCFCHPTGHSPRTTYQLQLALTLPPRSQGDGPFPTILFFHGFGGHYILSSDDYTLYAEAAAAAGFALLQYDVVAGGGWLGIAPDPVELQFLPPLLAWLARTAAAPGTPAAGRLDLGCLAVAGHSRGGKLAALHFAAHPHTFFAAFLLDPVECTCMAPCASNCFPSAAAALAAARRPLAAVGASVRGCCNPGGGAACGAACAAACYWAAGNATCTGHTYQDFVAAGGAGGQALLQTAGHMQFAALPPAKQFLADAACGADDGATSQGVCAEAAGHMLDWFRAGSAAGRPAGDGVGGSTRPPPR